MTMEAVSRALGVPSVTLKGWLDASQLVPVRVVEDPAIKVRLVLGRGHVDLTVAELGSLVWGG